MKFLTYTNRGYLKILENLAKNFEQPFMQCHTLVVECLDNDSFKMVKRWNIRNVHPAQTISNVATWLSDFGNFNAAIFNEVVKFKFSLVLHHLTEDLWYLDADIGIFQDPALFVSDVKRFDWLMQLDEPPSVPCNWCTGCFRIRNTRASKMFLLKFMQFYSNKRFSNHNDQAVFNQFLGSTEFNTLCVEENFSIATLDRKLFQNGLNAFENEWHKRERPVLVHANYRRGEEAKIKALVACGKWFMNT